MLKMRIFWKNTVKIATASSIASGNWGLGPQTSASLFSPTITTLSSSFLPLNAFLCT